MRGEGSRKTDSHPRRATDQSDAECAASLDHSFGKMKFLNVRGYVLSAWRKKLRSPALQLVQPLATIGSVWGMHALRQELRTVAVQTPCAARIKLLQAMTTTWWHRIQTSTAAFRISSGRLVFGEHKLWTVLSLLWWALGTAEMNEGFVLLYSARRCCTSLTFPDGQTAQDGMVPPRGNPQLSILVPRNRVSQPLSCFGNERRVGALAFAGVGRWHSDDRNLCNQRHLGCLLFQSIRTAPDAHCQQ